MPDPSVDALDTPQMRRAGKALLSLGLIDARNRSLRWAAAFDGSSSGIAPVLHTLGRLGWCQEHGITRNLQCQRGEAGDPTRPRLASILPEADAWFADPVPPADADAGARPAWPTVRQYLVDSLEATLELLETAGETDAALHFYRRALFEEDAAAERFAVVAQSLGLDAGLTPMPPSRPAREPLLFPSTRASIGSERGGYVPEAERWAHAVQLPEFEIDAQAVSWSQYGEFVEDGGYDDRRFWSDAGWQWVQAEGRRTPRYVDQLRQGVLQHRFGRLVRVPSMQPTLHVGWFEADAWCCWAGRRLPGEAEWETAAVLGANRGFRWGEVREWTAGTLRPYPGSDPAQSSDSEAAPRPEPEVAPQHEAARVLRGASFATAGRLRAPTARIGAPPASDELFAGFRSCAA